MSVAVIPMAEELGWSALDRGLVNSAFFWGYSVTQIPAGWVSTKCAVRPQPQSLELCSQLTSPAWISDSFLPASRR